MVGVKYDPDKNHRRSLRLPSYDYAQAGAYFVTLCTHGRASLFGDVADGEMRLHEFGAIVQEEWLRTAMIRPGVGLDIFQVMPNHFHGIVFFGVDGDVGAHGRAPLPEARTAPLHRPARSLGSLVAGFKSAVTARINTVRGTRGTPAWQRNYYEHVIRNEGDLDSIRQYIVGNPAKWAEDQENPGNAPVQGRV